MSRGPAYTDSELVILTLLALLATTIVVGVLGLVIRRIYKAGASRRCGKALTRTEPA
ncbi:MAG: hypothetical protein JWR25_498 [Noviherbaspirillum sp.]|jgi:hypothetical protein|nr:hypothetical protein [Noviherbaspirillum sp.]MDB5794119.1 hypothetical protein [Noviherbaspirillum sp.]